jgi:hypothetical protein
MSPSPETVPITLESMRKSEELSVRSGFQPFSGIRREPGAKGKTGEEAAGTVITRSSYTAYAFVAESRQLGWDSLRINHLNSSPGPERQRHLPLSLDTVPSRNNSCRLDHKPVDLQRSKVVQGRRRRSASIEWQTHS